ncbi:protein translocase subunit SecD [Basilea psittacipulmonis]|uniref:Protein translocase subunit SecD n=1 Tax=Basilea psittacipulmonis DSM 24701 TaxID=1072685 RepID=A0A077DEA7_9BURK|nr:protein translocase subunit SecD [Basilea psittacipulmonis]AIL33039.1 preprotein translocase subunit SecD [Basilea psittacipulmonis DSM 24701]
MNRYPLWKYILVLVVLVIGIIYTVPNFFGDSPAVQVSSANITKKVDLNTQKQIETILANNHIEPLGIYYQSNNNVGTIHVRFSDTDTQIRARDLLQSTLNANSETPDYTVALNLLTATPDWLTSLGAHPMYLGLDLRGGVHFLLQVDMQGALDAAYNSLLIELRTTLNNQKIPVNNISKNGSSLVLSFSNASDRDKALAVLRNRATELTFMPSDADGRALLTAEMTPSQSQHIRENALKQNIQTLHNRINELGVAEPIIQQQGSDRIVVELPGIQDVAKAKDILGRTATLELRLVDDSVTARSALLNGTVPFGLQAFKDTNGTTVLVRRQVLLTGENLENAQSGRNAQTGEPTVNLTLDSKGARIFRDVTRDNINKRLAIILFENGVGQVVTAPVIRSEIPNGQVEISGSMTAQQAADTALLLRAGSLAAPMHIIEERTIGPQLGAENIKKGFDSTLYGFIAIVIFMLIYYHLFGVFSSVGLALNVLLLLAALSLLQATLTLPGIAAIALTLGMAIDANVLINERIREELRAGLSPQQAINIGFDRAWGTILDSNLTSLIVGVALLAFGTGPIRGFAVVHVLGILTSMFSAVVGVRALVNLWYGSRRKLKNLSIGTVWNPDAEKK